MGILLSGAEVVRALNETLTKQAEQLKAHGAQPMLAIVRVGERSDDIAYENGAVKRCEKLGVAVKKYFLPETASQDELLAIIDEINHDKAIHGCLLFRPLPKHMDEQTVCQALKPEKDVDCITSGSLAGVFANTAAGFPPCTAQACLEILDYYGYELKGKYVVAVGRSLVIGRPVAMMLMHRNATITICHTRTLDMPSICRNAEILIVAAGKANVVDETYVAPGQVVIDVGINVDENGSLCGDVAFDRVKDAVAAITPVPGGVGTVTTSVLAKHVIEAAKRAAGVTL